MDEIQLARILEETARTAEERGYGTMTSSICLFGIRYAEEIRGCDATAHRLCDLAGVGNYGPTINLGVRLSQFVEFRAELLQDQETRREQDSGVQGMSEYQSAIDNGVDVSQPSDRRRTLIWSGGTDGDVRDPESWTVVDDSGGMLLDSSNRDDWQAAAFRTLARGGVCDADAE